MDYVYTSSSLSKEICEQIIQKYDSELQLKYEGVTASGLDKNIKDTQDMVIPENEEWNDMNGILSNELQIHMKIYMNQIERGDNYYSENNFGQDYHHLNEKLIQVNPFMIQRYEKQKGKYVYHHDGSNDKDKSRVVTYLWYLNDVIEGGETEFFGGSFKVKPETGKLLLFPACWCYPHRGNTPISSSKYILTGWLYTENKKSTHIVPKISIPPSQIHTGETEEINFIFKYFYRSNRELFMNYKQKRKTNESIFEDFTIPTYTLMMTSWLKYHIREVTERTNIEAITEIREFVISSFRILVDQIKERYRLTCQFNIKGWFILYNESEPFDLVYDLCIQTDLSTGDSHVSRYYKNVPGYQLVYFIEFTFHYMDKDNETKILTLSEIIDPCIDLF